MTFEEYIEDLCRQHPAILHEVDDKCHFSCLADDSQTKLARTMKYPCVVVDTGDFTFGGQVANVLMNTEYSIAAFSEALTYSLIWSLSLFLE